MNDILRDAILNELRLTLEKWTLMVESLERNESTYSPSDYNRLKSKIADLEKRLTA